MKKNSISIILGIIIFLGLLPLASYATGFKLGSGKGGQDIKNTYVKQHSSDLGELLQEVSFVITLEGQASQIDGRVISLKKGLEEKKVFISNLASFVKGADFNEPDGWSKADLPDIRINSKLRVVAYMVNSKELTAYQVFIYQ